MDDLAAMARLLDALRPWLDELVIVGGWAHQLHRYHPHARPPEHAPLRTEDADIAFSSSAPLAGNIADALTAAGFHEEFLGEQTRPVIHYHLGGEEQGFYAEFLAPLLGDGLARDGGRQGPISKAGVTAQRLRYLEILLVNPWPVGLETARGFPISVFTDVKLSNPVSFIAQKLLIRTRREADKKAQDVLYIHDTLELFGHTLDVLRAEWRERVSPSLAPKTARKVDQLRREQFGAVTDVIRNAARLPADRVLSPERVQAACAYGLEEIFGTS